MIAAAPDVYPPDLATMDGLRDARMYEYLESRPWTDGFRRCGYDEIARAFPDRPGPGQAACLGALGVRYFLTRAAVPGSVRIGGGEPPAVGAYEIRGAIPASPARDGPPRGLLAGLAASVAGLASHLRRRPRRRLPPPRIIRALMDATPISKIGRRAGGPAVVEGWLYNKRSSGKIQFLIMRDGTGYVQVVVPKAEVPAEVWDAAERATQEASIRVTGTVREEKRRARRLRDVRRRRRDPGRLAATTRSRPRSTASTSS